MGNYHELGYGGPNIEACFDTLTSLVNRGWRLKNIVLSEKEGSNTLLPTAAFDGIPLTAPLASLQQEWEQLLA